MPVQDSYTSSVPELKLEHHIVCEWVGLPDRENKVPAERTLQSAVHAQQFYESDEAKA